MKNKKWGSAAERRAKYLNRVASELAEEYELTSRPYTIPVDIIFQDNDNDKYLKSYKAAMLQIRKEIEEIKELIEDSEGDL
jgi:hypothetical protein